MPKIFSEILYVGAGGFIGAILRYYSNIFAGKIFDVQNFPYGTFLVNIIGSFCIGIVWGIADNIVELSNEAKYFMIVGILGSYTTFSTFAYETFQLIQQGRTIAFLSNLLFQTILGIIAVLLGIRITETI